MCQGRERKSRRKSKYGTSVFAEIMAGAPVSLSFSVDLSEAPKVNSNLVKGS